MPRVLKIDSITNRPICKSAGAGGFLGTSVNIMKCHNKARIGLGSQCFRCRIPVLGIDKKVGCNENSGYTCGSGTGDQSSGSAEYTSPFEGMVWGEQIGDDLEGEYRYDWNGHSVSLSNNGSGVAIGGNLNDGNGNGSGHVRIYFVG